MPHRFNDENPRIREEYQEVVKHISPKSRIYRNCFRAFWVGGIICTVGYFVKQLGILLEFSEDEVIAFVPIVMITLGAILTGIGIYDRMGAYAGAGTIIPITGFANSIVSSAMEFKHEGWVMGTAAKMFSIAGPVIVFGYIASFVVGLIYFFIGVFS